MVEINAALVARLREMTSAGLMNCKRALTETHGDLEAAVDLLRKRGIATAAKKSVREAKEGLIAQFISPDSQVGVLAEVNCETDFVAKNEGFRAFADAAVRALAANPQADIEASRAAQVAQVGENIRLSRWQRWEVQGHGLVAAYIHTGAKVGVLVEVGSGKPTTVTQDAFKQLVRDLTLQIAAASPLVVAREKLDPAVVAKEQEIATAQAKDKPPQAMAKIIAGKLEKFYQTVCLLDQGFVKQNSEITVQQHIQAVSKQLDDPVDLRRFIRYQVGEAIDA